MKPNEALWQFLTGLPPILHDQYYSRLLMFLGVRFGFTDSSGAFVTPDYQSLLKPVVDPAADYDKPRAVVVTVGILDYMFNDVPLYSSADYAESAVLRDAAPGMDFRNAHINRVTDEWRRLRAKELSFETIRQWEREIQLASMNPPRTL
ncbi:hypothetical protein [Cystobacter fuscus]|uniref:hypothetical protein n=1 Tax=Cystobacter fuscus TaxID=43 RepID=UPI002B28C7C3|nr:hypothetical protein F0U63_31375 [Cystobacter fuscus]